VTVLGIDVDQKKVELLNNGQSYIKLLNHLPSRKFSASSDFNRIKGVEAIIICVP
jgi:UDP-N-acetyl-D-glucosamine dehydrogenase